MIILSAGPVKLLIEALKTDADKNMKWFADNNMKINPEKFIKSILLKPFHCKTDHSSLISQEHDSKKTCQSNYFIQQKVRILTRLSIHAHYFIKNLVS